MENEHIQESKKGFSPLIVGFIVIVVIAVAAFGFLSLNPASTQNNSSTTDLVPTPTATMEKKIAAYADGRYSQIGEYTSPGGEEELGVTLTLQNNLIQEVEVEVKATQPISKKMQIDFAENYREMVIGKSIDEVKLVKVSGSSLTPKGFNDALEKIKEQARS
jgi:hypothetical protein